MAAGSTTVMACMMRIHVSQTGSLAWEGPVGPFAAELDGPVGLRSDNGRFELKMLARLRPSTLASPMPCHTEPGD
jgi:hypothetical protein